ncbi:hypothetical protein ACFSSC_11390 [Corynebacterium mendelii]
MDEMSGLFADIPSFGELKTLEALTKEPIPTVEEAIQGLRGFWKEYYEEIEVLYSDYVQAIMPFNRPGSVTKSTLIEHEESLIKDLKINSTYANKSEKDKWWDVGKFLLESIHPQDRPLMIIALIDEVIRKAVGLKKIDRNHEFVTLVELFSLPIENKTKRNRYIIAQEWVQNNDKDTIVKFLGAVACKEQELSDTKPTQISYLLGTVKGDSVTDKFIFNRAFPESFSFKDNGEDLAIVWMLKNPGYGQSLANTLNGGAISEKNETRMSILLDQANLCIASTKEGYLLPWEPLQIDTEEMKRLGWYRKRTNKLNGDSLKQGRIIKKDWQGANSLGRLELYPYRSKGSNDIPKLLGMLQESYQIVLPSLMCNIRLLLAILKHDDKVRFSVRDQARWELLIGQCPDIGADKSVLKTFTNRIISRRNRSPNLSTKNLRISDGD